MGKRLNSNRKWMCVRVQIESRQTVNICLLQRKMQFDSLIVCIVILLSAPETAATFAAVKLLEGEIHVETKQRFSQYKTKGSAHW